MAGSAAGQQRTDAPAIASADEAINVFDLERAARRNMRDAHWGYLDTGVLDDATVEANRKGFLRWGLTARRLVDVSRIDLSCRLFDETWGSPVALAPVSSQRAFHQDGERPVAKAAGRRNALLMLSTLTTVSVETVARDRAGPFWFQLYPTDDRAAARRFVERADAAGASAIVLTADLLAGGMRRETLADLSRRDGGNCAQCHEPGLEGFLKRKAMFDSVDRAKVRSINNPSLTWGVLGEMRGWTGRRLLVKGVMTPDDATRAVEAGADGIIVSNHGGRAEESLIATIDVLPAIAAAVRGRAAVVMDGGIRRGTDVFKALALGADAVAIGRPYVWGSAAFGEAGVAAAMRLIDEELRSAMQQTGAVSLADITADRIVRLA